MATVATISFLVGAVALGFARLSTSLEGATAGMMVATVGVVCFALSGLAWVFG